MGDVVNLRQFRKRKARDDKEIKAEKNRQAHGISTKLRKRKQLENEIEQRKLDGKNLGSEPTN
jgi:hypothetical protein